MNKTVAGIILAVVSVGLIGGVLAMSGRDSNSSSDNTSQTQSSDSMNMTDSQMAQMNSNSSNNQAASTSPVETTEVEIEDYAFNPKTIRVKVGSTVKWTNKDQARHDVMPDNPSEDFKASELLAKGESYSFTFNKAGTYTYFCSPHPYMKATVEVVE
jgi:plastocyanin